MLVGLLLHIGAKWEDLPPLPRRDEVSVDCYRQAIRYAQTVYDENAGLKVTPHQPLPTREEFEYLLWLYKEEEWFESDLRGERHDDIAVAIDKKVRERLGVPKTGSAEIATKQRSSQAILNCLKDLQRKWGAGWLLAIHAVCDYKWQV